MTTGFLTVNGDGRLVDVDDLLVRRELFAEGRLWTWGLGLNYGLGDGTLVTRSSPVTTAGGGINWKQVNMGGQGAIAIKTDGTLWTWGPNNFGQNGDNTSSPRSSPVTTTGGGTNWKQAACGAEFKAAVKTNGNILTWGRNESGQLGDGTIVTKSTPVNTTGAQGSWKQVACGYNHAAAVKTDGTLWTWGNNGSYQLGDGTAINKSSPITTAGGGTTWKQVSGGRSHSAAVKTDGTLWAWGEGVYGTIGDGTSSYRSSPVTTAAGGTNWKQVACGDRHNAAIKSDGTLWTWGRNESGQLGDNTSVNKSSPVTTVAGGTNWKQVAGGDRHTAAIKTDGTLWTWGYNLNGELGDNTSVIKSSPVTTVAGGTNWKQVAASACSSAVTDLSLGSL